MDTIHPTVLLPKFDRNGLVPVIVQNKNTHQILMLAYANRAAYELTLKTGYAHFYSRSRQRLWKKGEESGNLMRVEDVWIDCDGDALIYVVVPSGPACHTGKVTCFWRSVVGFCLDTKEGQLQTEICEVCKAIAKA